MNIELFLSAYFNILIFYKSIWFCFGIKIVLNYLEKRCFSRMSFTDDKYDIFDFILLRTFTFFLDLSASVFPQRGLLDIFDISDHFWINNINLYVIVTIATVNLINP